MTLLPSSEQQLSNDDAQLTQTDSTADTNKADSPANNVTALTPSTEDNNSPKATKTPAKSKAKTDQGSIRVGVDKVDSLINLVGELVITQSMLSELGNDFDLSKVEKLTAGLEQLLQNTKELQESVMRIRMLPISFAFNRFSSINS